MVSTRQSSNVGGSEVNSSSVDVAPPPSGGIKTRHTSAQLQQQSSSPPYNFHEPPSSNVCSATSSSSTPYVGSKQFLDLPVEIMYKIFSYTGYKTVAQTRLVCRQLDKTCGAILNSTFQKLQTQMLHRFQNIKNKMPRRESARRNHPLACESDIIETLHMRLALLQMSFGKHIERKYCCFFAGEILDEVYRILHYIKVTPKLARPYRVTDELFDLSTMAMEYFKEHIEPTLPEITYFGTDFLDFPGGLQQSPPHSSKVEYESSGPGEDRPTEPPAPTAENSIAMRKRMRKIRQGLKKHNDQLLLLKREYRSFKSKMTEQAKQFHDVLTRMDDYDKKNEETSRKFGALLQELNKCKTELQYWRSKSPFTSFCLSCSKMTPGSATMEELQAWAASAGFPSSFFWNSVVEPLSGSSSSTEPLPSTSTAGLLDDGSATIVDTPPIEQLATASGSASASMPVGKQATKRKGAALHEASKKQKRPRAVLKVRNKRS